MKIPIRTSRKAISNVAATGILIATTVMMIISSYAIVLGYGQSSSTVIAADLTTSTYSAQSNTEKVLISGLSGPEPYSDIQLSLSINQTIFVADITGITVSTNEVVPSLVWSAPLPNSVSVSYKSLEVNGNVATNDYFLIGDTIVGQPLTFDLMYGTSSTIIGSVSWISA